MGCTSSMDTNSVLDEPTGGMAGMVMPSSQWPLTQANSTDVVFEFVRLDEKVSKLESTCPGPRLATCEAWLEYLQGKQTKLTGIDAKQIKETFQKREEANNAFTSTSSEPGISQQQPSLPSQIADNDVLFIDGYTAEHALPYNNNKAVAYGNLRSSDQNSNNITNGLLPITSNRISANQTKSDAVSNRVITHSLPVIGNGAETSKQDLINLALTLGITGDVQKASTHEDFFAQLSESDLHLITISCYNEILEHTKIRLKTLLDSYAELNELYVNHDGIIAFISGGTYISSLEESLDSQLVAARDVRDKLGSTLEQWRICGLLLRASANSASQGLKQWRKVKTIVNPREKLETALFCRRDLQSSIVSLECAQFSLPHVEIKHLSKRQILAVKHCNTYMVTDVVNAARYEHTSKVYLSYESSISKASAWLYETFNKTLRIDFNRAEETVQSLAKALRDHRENIFTTARR